MNGYEYDVYIQREAELGNALLSLMQYTARIIKNNNDHSASLPQHVDEYWRDFYKHNPDCAILYGTIAGFMQQVRAIENSERHDSGIIKYFKMVNANEFTTVKLLYKKEVKRD